MNSRVLSAGSVLLPVIILSAAACPISAKSGHIRSTPSPTAAVRAANEAATIEPKTGDFVNAGLVYAYSENAVYRVYTVPERVTDVALQTGEELVAVASGDTVRWIIGDTSSGTGASKRVHLLIKPAAAGLSTNLVITTDRRTYHLALASSAGSAMATLSWSYPQDELLAIQRARTGAEAAAPVAAGLSLDDLDFGYAITGDRPAWRPLRAFDDGRQTYIEFPKALGVGEAPPLFLVDGNNKASLVNYRVKGHFYVVDRLFAAAELRLGGKHQDVVRIVRTAEGQGKQARRRAS